MVFARVVERVSRRVMKLVEKLADQKAAKKEKESTDRKASLTVETMAVEMVGKLDVSKAAWTASRWVRRKAGRTAVESVAATASRRAG
jgi:hypothetical protein